MRLFNGREIANKILKGLESDIKRKKIRPKLAVILVGNDAPSKIYVRLKKEAGEKIGIKVDVYKFKANVKENDVLAKIEELNQDSKVHGIIVQLPLPTGLNKNKITNAINPQKDVDGFHRANQRLLAKNKPRFVPPLPAAILLAIKDAYRVSIPMFSFAIPAQAGIQNVTDNKLVRLDPRWSLLHSDLQGGDDKLRGKKAFALVNSDTFGNVLKMVLRKEKVKLDYLARKVCMISGSEEELKDADILITACGCPNLIGKNMIKKGAVLVDAGITRYQKNYWRC